MDQFHYSKLPKKIIIYGGTGQAKVVRPIINYYGSSVAAIFDDTPDLHSPFDDVDIFVGLEGLKSWLSGIKNRSEIGFVVAIGNPHGRVRLKLHEKLVNEGLIPTIIIHPSAIIAENAIIGEGSQIMAGAIVMPEAIIGKECIINTKASVDHECLIEDGSEIAPGATLCGSVHLGVNVWICAGATILPRLTIGHDSIVGAGAVVLRDVRPSTTIVGIPAKKILK